MRETITINVEQPQFTTVTGMAFSQVDSWFGHTRRDLKMDIIYPENPKRLYPCIVWICGGAWVQMDKSAHLAYLAGLARKGFVVASVEYRTCNEGPYPMPLIDIKSGIRYLRAHADEYGIDPAKVVIGGESAGGNLASMTGVTNGLAEFEKGEYLEQSSSVSAVINYYGPTSLGKAKRDEKSFDGVPLPETTALSSLIQYLGFHPGEEPERAAKSTAQYYVNQDTVPFFMAHGTADSLVDISASDAFYDVLVQNHVPVEYYRIQGAGHMGMEFYQDEMCQRIHDFLEKVFAG